jgi:hypothetical protein
LEDLNSGVDIGNDVFGRWDSKDLALEDKAPLALGGEAMARRNKLERYVETSVIPMSFNDHDLSFD